LISVGETEGSKVLYKKGELVYFLIQL